MSKQFKRKLIHGLSRILVISMFTTFIQINAAIDEDEAIASEPVEVTYTGRLDGDIMLNNLQFGDVTPSFWGAEAIARMGSLDVVKGYDVPTGKAFRPDNEVSNQEALTFIMRAVGLEEEAKIAAENIQAADEDTTGVLWAKGYLTMAQTIGLIDNQELADALIVDQTVLDPEFSFIREDFVTREQMAQWLVQAIQSQNQGLIEPIYRQQNIYNYSDWESIGLEFVPYVEAVIRADIMVGDQGVFYPKDYLTRAEMIQAMKNMDTILYDTMSVTVKEGYIGHINSTETISGGRLVSTEYLVRKEDGKVDALIHKVTKDSMDHETHYDAIVYKNGVVTNMSALREGDEILYIVDEETQDVLYIQIKQNENPVHLTGILRPITNLSQGQITILNDVSNPITYTMSSSLYDLDKETVIISDKTIGVQDVPVTDYVTLTIKNQTVTEIAYGGTLSPVDEFSGIVIEHNETFNYIRVSDWEGNEVIKRYVEGEVDVEKEAYYDEEDQVGYFDQLYPYYGYDEDDTNIGAIEHGDIVHIRLNINDLEYIEAISAKTNYTVKFGEVLTAIYEGDDGVFLTIEMEDKTVVSYTVLDDVPVIKGDINVSVKEVESGDMVRLLVNQSVTSPGTIQENVKEISIDPYGNIAEKVYRGELGNINKSQETLSLMNSYELNQTGWSKFTEAYILDVSGNEIEYYYEGKRITLDYADKYLRREGMDTYVLTEYYYGDERVRKITFRDGRDSVIDYSNVTLTNGFNEIRVSNYDGSIEFDEGTIIVKNDKIISASNIVAPDYAQVVLNGEDEAAVIYVKPEPNNDAISIFRGRIARINELEDFTVQSHASLNDMEWIYSPIERTYQLDYGTIIKQDEETVGVEAFIGYTDISKIDEVYTIISDGVTASYISGMPYTIEGVMGEVFQVDEDGIHLKDTLVYNGESKEWNELSLSDSYSLIEVVNESIIIKNNEVVTLEELEIGDRLSILTDTDLAEQLKLDTTRDVIGYIIRVE